MSIRKDVFLAGEYYHVYNRGVEKRDIFLDQSDLDRFICSLEEFNVSEPIGSIYEHSFNKEKQEKQRLVEIVCYSLNPNHYHLIIKPLVDDGITKFMQRLGTGYSKYFNLKRHRSGSLFQGKFKAAHIHNNDDLLRLSVYVNLNNIVHQLGSKASKLSRSSWENFIERVSNNRFGINIYPSIILDQFNSIQEYIKFAEDLLPILIEKKKEERQLEASLILE